MLHAVPVGTAGSVRPLSYPARPSSSVLLLLPASLATHPLLLFPLSPSAPPIALFPPARVCTRGRPQSSRRRFPSCPLVALSSPPPASVRMSLLLVPETSSCSFCASAAHFPARVCTLARSHSCSLLFPLRVLRPSALVLPSCSFKVVVLAKSSRFNSAESLLLP